MVERDAFQPATLTIACEGARALFLSHAQDQLIERINGFFGYPAIDRIRIVQKPVSASGPTRRSAPRLAENESRRLEGMLSGIEDDRLKTALERLGKGVIAGRRRGR
jgi:hypothetical protein